ncbi:MAG TPA: hypothetical protein DHW42_04265 [Candidatus Marinimicrobia bacterium]|nr:hypothetical protein [Candidatus Neomarinimicrobiota bacterium]
MTRKSKVTIIVLDSSLVIGILVLVVNNLMQTSQKGKELQEWMGITEGKNEEFKKVNINTADIETLVKLPGIGPVKAQSIIDYREKIGKFESLYEIAKVKGIGKATVAKLEPYLKIIGDSAEVKSSLRSEGAKAITSKININTASLNELTILPGIGEKKAQAIIKYREGVGNFKSKDEIKNVKEIGNGVYKKIKRKIEVK